MRLETCSSDASSASDKRFSCADALEPFAEQAYEATIWLNACSLPPAPGVSPLCRTVAPRPGVLGHVQYQ